MKIWGYRVTIKPQGTGKFPAASPIFSFGVVLSTDPCLRSHHMQNTVVEGSEEGFCLLDLNGKVCAHVQGRVQTLR